MARISLLLLLLIGFADLYAQNPEKRFKKCKSAPWTVPRRTEGPQSRGCIVTFQQALVDSVLIRELDTKIVDRRYLVYVPDNLPKEPVPVVFVFPGKGVNAEIMAYNETHTRFEALADRDHFIVVYGNGIPSPSEPWEGPPIPYGGYLQGCFLDHSSEGLDVTYVRMILDQLASQYAIDRKRIYATGESAGGGMSFQLAIEAPDLVAAVAPEVPLPFQPSGRWLYRCQPGKELGKVSILMLAATDDAFISYRAGSSERYRGTQYPGMEETRDAWLRAMSIQGKPKVDTFPDLVLDDSYEPATLLKSSFVERSCYPLGPLGQEFCYLKAVGMGHRWPSPHQTPEVLWDRFGKTNQDIDFADVAWEFFKKHPRVE